MPKGIASCWRYVRRRVFSGGLSTWPADLSADISSTLVGVRRDKVWMVNGSRVSSSQLWSVTLGLRAREIRRAVKTEDSG